MSNYKFTFEQCDGQIVYKDGTTEQIIACRELADQCEVATPFGQYIYVPYVICDKSGYKMGSYYFARFDFDLNEYIRVDNIKEFQLYEEPTNE